MDRVIHEHVHVKAEGGEDLDSVSVIGKDLLRGNENVNYPEALDTVQRALSAVALRHESRQRQSSGQG